MSLDEKFITGRLRRRLLRAPVVEGWLCSESGAEPPVRASLALLEGDAAGALGLAVRGQRDRARLSARAAQVVAHRDDLELTVGWPEPLVVVRRAGVVLYAEGDACHFGPLQLDAVRGLRRSGFAYLSDASLEVRVELELDNDDEVTTALLGPSERVSHGPYLIEHGRSFDPSDRPTSLRHHSYELTIVRDPAAGAPTPRPQDVPAPYAIENPATIVALARQRHVLSDDEGYLAEPAKLAERLRCYEGAANQLEEAIRAAGPAPAAVRRLADALELVTVGVLRDDTGRARIARAILVLHATGTLRVSRERLEVAPGRLRKAMT